LTVAPPEWTPESEPDLTTTVCPAELGAPLTLLKVMQIRLPEGMTAESVIEVTPDFARLGHPVESVSCIDSMPGALISFLAVTNFSTYDPSKSMPAVRDEVLAAFGYRAPSFSAEVNDELEGSYEVVIDQPADPDAHAGQLDAEPARAYLRLKVHDDQIYAVIYECHPDAWNALEASLRASAASITFSSP
jgi:hypothetical protein